MRYKIMLTNQNTRENKVKFNRGKQKVIWSSKLTEIEQRVREIEMNFLCEKGLRRRQATVPNKPEYVNKLTQH